MDVTKQKNCYSLSRRDRGVDYATLMSDIPIKALNIGVLDPRNFFKLTRLNIPCADSRVYIHIIFLLVFIAE